MSTDSTKRILVVKLSSLGDIVHALPAVHCLKRGLGAAIDWVVHDRYIDLVKCFTDVDETIPCYRNEYFSRLGRFVRDLRKKRYDAVVDMQGLFKSGLAARLARSSRRIGPTFRREGAGLFYTEVASGGDRNRHAVDVNLDLPRHLGLDASIVTFPTSFPKADVSEGGPRIAISPISQQESKNWPVDSYAAAAEQLRKQLGATIYLVGGHDASEACTAIQGRLGDGVVNQAGRTDLPGLGGLLGKMHLVICNDSGPLHLAVAVGTAVLGIYITTSPGRTGPYGDGNRVVGTGNGRVPGVDEVIAAAISMCGAS